MDAELRARAFLDLVLGKDSRPRDPQATDTTGQDGGGAHQPPGAGPAGGAAGGFAGQVTLKQQPGWRVDQLPDGTFRWTTPSGRSYTTEPTRYPI